MGQYFYLNGTTPVGPFSLQDFYTLLDREVIGPATMVCKEHGAEWQALQSIPELNGKANSAAPAETASTEPSGRRRRNKGRINLTAVIIAFLFSAVAVYITYTINRAWQESAQNSQEMDRLLGR